MPIVLPDPEPEPATKPEPTVEPKPDPEPEAEPAPAVDYSGYYAEVKAMPAVEPVIEAAVATNGALAADRSVGSEEPGLLASTNKSTGSDSPIVAYDSSSSNYVTGGGSGEGESVLDQLMSPEGLKETSTTFAAVAAVGTLMGLVGLGASMAGAAIVGAATIGTAGAVGLSTAADLAADLAAAGAAGGAAAKRRRKDEEEEPQEEGTE